MQPPIQVISVIIVIIVIICVFYNTKFSSRLDGVCRLSEHFRARPQEPNSLCPANRKYPWEAASGLCWRQWDYSVLIMSRDSPVTGLTATIPRGVGMVALCGMLTRGLWDGPVTSNAI